MRLLRERWSDLFICLLLAVAATVMYSPALNSFYLFDDLYVLRYASEYKPFEFFVNPGVWRKVSISSLTPWVTVSFSLDYHLSGFNPSGFYLHHVISLWLASVALYLLLKEFVNKGFALMGSVMFEVSSPAAAVAEMLMARHYVEGLLFGLLCFLFFTKALKKNSLRYSLIAALFYFLSASSKEIFVPLSIALLFYPGAGLRQRLLHSAPLLSIFFVYLIWRNYMLGDLVAGTSGSSALLLCNKGLPLLFLKHMYGSFLMLPGYIGKNLSGILMLLGVASTGAASCGILIRKKHYGVLLFFLVLLTAVYSVPFLAGNLYDSVSEFFHYRLMILIAAFLAGVASLSMNYLYEITKSVESGRLRRNALCCILLLSVGMTLLVFYHSFSWISNNVQTTLRPLIAEGKFFIRADKDLLLVNSLPAYSPTHYYENLEFFKWKFFGKASPMVANGPFFHVGSINVEDMKDVKAFKYDPGTGAMAEYTKVFFERRSAFLERVRKMPLSVSLRVNHGIISFSLGPYEVGRYSLLAGYKPGVYCTILDVPRIVRVRGHTGLSAYLRFVWESPEGWVTFSPEWFIDLSEKREIVWER